MQNSKMQTQNMTSENINTKAELQQTRHSNPHFKTTQTIVAETGIKQDDLIKGFEKLQQTTFNGLDSLKTKQLIEKSAGMGLGATVDIAGLFNPATFAISILGLSGDAIQGARKLVKINNKYEGYKAQAKEYFDDIYEQIRRQFPK